MNANFDIGLLWIHAPLFLSLSSKLSWCKQLSSLFPFQLLAEGLPFTSDSPPHRQTQELTSLSPCFEVSCFDTAKNEKEKAEGGSPSCCNTWSQSACMNKNYAPLSFELRVNRTISLQPELNKHPARLSGRWGTAVQCLIYKLLLASAALPVHCRCGMYQPAHIHSTLGLSLSGREALWYSTWLWICSTAVPYNSIRLIESLSISTWKGPVRIQLLDDHRTA